MHLKLVTVVPWPASSGGESVVLLQQGRGFDPQSGRTQEATDECINKWNNKSVFLPPFICLSPNLISNFLNGEAGKFYVHLP